KDNDAILITTGSKDTVNLDNPGSDLKGVLSGYDFLASVYMEGVDNYLKNPKYDLGAEIVVIGGGDTSLDCARTALRLTKGKCNVQPLSLLSEEARILFYKKRLVSKPASAIQLKLAMIIRRQWKEFSLQEMLLAAKPSL